MPLTTIVLVVIVAIVVLVVFNLLFETFKVLVNILVIVGLLVWVLYATGIITSLPDLHLYWHNLKEYLSSLSSSYH